MSLSEQEQALRADNLGASEVAGALGLDPREGMAPIDVWLRKNTSKRPAVTPESRETPEMQVGSALEPAIAQLYSARTGRTIYRPQRSYPHPTLKFLRASPDALVVLDERSVPEKPETFERAAEFKAVGRWMIRDWLDDQGEESMPDYVRVQAQVQMMVCLVPMVDVFALVSATHANAPQTVNHDPAMAADLEDVLRDWWDKHIIHGEPPGPRDNEDRSSYLLKRFRVPSSGEIIPATSDAERLVNQRRALKADMKAAEAALDNIEALLKEEIGEHLGIEGQFGRLTWAPRQGRPSYKEALIEIAGSLDTDLLDRHRGAPFRVLLDQPAKE